MPGSQVSTTTLDTRVYVSPDGRRCCLEAGMVSGPWPRPMWSVALLDDKGMSPIAGVPAIEHLGTRAQARAAYRQRLAVLEAAGCRRVKSDWTAGIAV